MKKGLLSLLLLISIAGFSQSTTTIPALPQKNNAALNDTIPVQNGHTYRYTIQQLYDLIAGNFLTTADLTSYEQSSHATATYATKTALNNYLLSSDAASTYLTSINSSQVTTALGFTPYNATNPSGFITSSALSPYETSSHASSTYQPIGSYLTTTTGDARYSLLAHTHTFASLTSKPTTIAGYGITDAYPLTGNPSGFLVSSDIAGKQNTLVSGTTIKTINGTSLLGSGDIAITGGSGGSTTDASLLTSGTLADARLSGNVSISLTPTAIKTAAYTAAANDFVKTDATSGTIPITLPTAPANKTRIGVKMIAVSGSNTTTIATGGSDVFNKAGGSTSITLSLLNHGLTFQYESATGIWNVTSGDIPLSGLDARFATSAQVNTNTTSIANLRLKKDFGILIPQFKTVNKFDNIGSTLSTTQLAIHSSGTGLVSATGGTNADGYIRLPNEVTGLTNTRSDWLLSWDMSESTASMTLGIGEAATGYMITIANSGGNLVITWPSGATTTGAMTGTLSLSVSITTGNGSVTSSVQVLGTPAALATTNPYRVPVYENVKLSKNRLWYAYFKTNTTTSKITGFLHDMKAWDGDPTGQLLTASMIVNGASAASEHDNVIILPVRSNNTTPLKVVNFFHPRSYEWKIIVDITLLDNGESLRQLLYNGYAVIATTGGGTIYSREFDWWGNSMGVIRAGELYEVLAANVRNVGNEYLFGPSMGGVCALNYFRQNPERVKAIWLSCPVTDLEETGNAFAVQVSSSLKTSLDYAYMSWYLSIVASNTADPQTDNGTNYRRVSGPGQLPYVGVRNYAVTTVNATATNAVNITVASNAKLYSGDQIYFRYSGQTRTIVSIATGNTTIVTVDAAITLAVGDPVVVIRSDGRSANDLNAWNNRTNVEWTAGTLAAGVITKRKSAVPELDVRPYNPTRFADFYAEMNVPIHMYVANTGSTGNDGILNNAPMYAFRDAVNALNPNLVTLTAGSAATHLAPGTFSATDIVALFNAN